MNSNPDEPPSQSARVTLRPERPEDEALLYEVYAGTRTEEMALTGWDPATQAVFLEMQFRAMRRGYAQMFPQGEFSVIEVDGRPVGRVVVDRAARDLRVVDLALLPAYRGHGIGTQLMQNVLAEAAGSGLPVRLKVLSGSPAVRLYQRLGFVFLDDPGVYQEMEWRPTSKTG